MFPGVFRGTLDVRATTISDEMAMAAAHALADYAVQRGIHDDDILPRMDEWEVVPRVAVASGMKAQEQGLTKQITTPERLYERAAKIVSEARRATEVLLKEMVIPAAPC